MSSRDNIEATGRNLLWTIGGNVRRGRTRLGLSVHDLSLISGVPFGLISDLEMHAAADLDVMSLVALSDALMSDLFELPQ
jgi:hypothetical protein